jgi:hypothetical protein
MASATGGSMNLPVFLSLALIAASIGTLIHVFKDPGRYSKYISVRKVGILERDLLRLRRVIVVANQIDPPTGTLLEAVKDNFSEGVHYLFLVSKSQGTSAREEWFQLFEAIARVVKYQKKFDIPVDELVNIKTLDYEWPSEPHIFYQYESTEDCELTTVCFRGNSSGHGISEFYEIITDSSIEAMLRGLLGGAPSDVEIGSIVLDDNPNRANVVEKLNNIWNQ